MIEKLMKAVKSSNKKRGRNITIGAVVGFLLSCTAVMGTDEYLWIRENAGEIEFNTILTTDKDGSDGSTNTYINNTTLSSSANNGKDEYNNNISYGLRLSGDLGNFNFINNGIVSGSGSGINISGSSGVSITNEGLISGSVSVSVSGYGYGSGINISDSSVVSITNEGAISGSGSVSGYGFGSGINISDSSVVSITNEGAISGSVSVSVSGYGYGINISDSSVVSITNEGAISGSGSGSGSGYSFGSGINISNNSRVENLINEGVISGNGLDYGFGYGIEINSSTVENLTNEGVIRGSGSTTGSGIYISNNSTVGNLTNEGLISGSGGYGYGYGIAIYNSTVKNLTNEGVISGYDSGIYISNSPVKNLTNTGVVYGKINAITKYDNSGTVNSAVNYGILANGDSLEEVVDGLKVVQGAPTLNPNEISNYGLIIKNGVIDGTVETNPKSFQIEFEDGTREMTIENKDDINITDSFSGDKTNHILNGLTDTYKATNGDNTVTGSIINAYQTAVAFDTAGGKLTLFGTTVNGGLDGKSYTIEGKGGADTLVLQSTTINGNINMGDKNDTLTIGNGTIINGTLDGGTGNDTLNFGTASNTRAGSGIDNNINIQHNISGFENMNINTNVTLFEKTIDASGGLTDLTVTGADNITIGKNGVLTLRIDPTKKDGADKITGHALYTTTGTLPTTTISSTGGKLLLALNGAGNSSIISFGSTVLDNTLITGHEGEYQEDVTLGTTSILHSVKRVAGKNNEIEVTALNNLPLYNSIHGYKNLNKIYQGILSVNELGNFNAREEDLPIFIGYLNDIYGGNPYSFSSELSRKSAGMFRDIVTENQFKANTGKWMIYGGLTHVDGGTKDTYYGKGYYTYDVGSSDIDADTKITGAYMLGEYGVSDTLTSGIVIGGNRLKSDLSNGSKVDGDALYLGAYAKKYIGNLKVTGGAGFQYGDYDADRLAINKVASEEAESVMKYSDNYNDITYDIYLNGRYSHNIGENLFLEPYATLSYTYIDQDGADEGSKTLAIETDSKSFDYTTAKVGLDLKKVIPHEKGKSTLSAGISYTRILDGADEEFITGRFKGGRDFDILVAHKNEHSIGLNAKYALELENGILFDVKGTYSVERDSHNQSGKNKTKGEWIVGAGLGYKF